MSSVVDQLALILQTLERTNDEIKRINTRLDRIEGSCDNMDVHVSFIDRVYESIRTPISRLTGITFTSAPQALIEGPKQVKLIKEE